MAAISQTTFSNEFSWSKKWYFDSNFTEVCSQGYSWKYCSIGSDNGLALIRWQAIIWTNDDPVRWCIYVALGGDELMLMINSLVSRRCGSNFKSVISEHMLQTKVMSTSEITVETLYSTIYYSKYFIELNLDKSTQYVALWTHKRRPIPRPFGRAMECLLWVFQQKLTVL